MEAEPGTMTLSYMFSSSLPFLFFSSHSLEKRSRLSLNRYDYYFILLLTIQNQLTGALSLILLFRTFGRYRLEFFYHTDLSPPWSLLPLLVMISIVLFIVLLLFFLLVASLNTESLMPNGTFLEYLSTAYYWYVLPISSLSVLDFLADSFMRSC